MPPIESDIHLRMLRNWRSRIRRLIPGHIYGLEWGDPDKDPALSIVRRYYLSYFIDGETIAVEIGPGGGRWTRYMLNARKIYAVDYHQELLDELAKKYRAPSISMIKNSGSDFPGIKDGEADFVFSFGVFVHLELNLIDSYLANIRRLLKPTSNVVIQYSDKTKPLAQNNNGFSWNTPDKMLALVRKHGYSIQDDNRWLLPHSSIVRFTT